MKAIVLDAGKLHARAAVFAFEVPLSSALMTRAPIRFRFRIRAPNKRPHKQEQPQEWSTVDPELMCCLTQVRTIVNDEALEHGPGCCQFIPDCGNLSNGNKHQDCSKKHSK
jgi:hypothetical protein